VEHDGNFDNHRAIAFVSDVLHSSFLSSQALAYPGYTLRDVAILHEPEQHDVLHDAWLPIHDFQILQVYASLHLKSRRDQ
jgi:hypothetical protein